MADYLRIKHKELDEETVRVQADLSRAELWQLIGLLSEKQPSSPSSIHHELLADLNTLRAELNWTDSWITPPRDEDGVS